MRSKIDNIEIIINDEADEVIEERFKSNKNRNQNFLESMKGSELVFDYVHLLHYKCHKINPNRGGSYIYSLECTQKWRQLILKRKNEVINKRAGGVIWKCKKYNIFIKKNLKINIWKKKKIVKLEIIVIISGNIEVLHIAYVI